MLCIIMKCKKKKTLNIKIIVTFNKPTYYNTFLYHYQIFLLNYTNYNIFLLFLVITVFKMS